ncbi:MAG: TIGR04211 family SH3 domain-containing protein [Sinobacteraceae bacterium]|nr:TIGR04211 family SH3 domain-containing protein [Nevskiaceae bacterium]
MTRNASRVSGACLLFLSLVAPVVYGDPVYVIEQLVVGIASAPGPEGERVGQVKSGDKLELLERQGDEAHVRLANGKEGWIKSSYVSSEEPLQQRLTARTAELDKLKQENEQQRQDLKRLQSELASARSAQGASAAAGVPTAASPTTAATPPEPAAPIRETVFLRPPERPGQTPWTYLLGVAVVMLLVGFTLGWKTLDRRIRQKYGGLRIY